MRRFATALIALFALVALVTAAGSFGGTEQPTLYSGTTPTEPMPVGPPPVAGGGENSTTATDSRDVIDDETPVPPDESGDGDGVSTLLVAGLFGGLLVAAVVAVLLTGDDARAPPRDESGGGNGPDGPPTPTVEPTYDSPADNAVVRAWRRLRERADADETATPGETATAAVERGYPDDAVESVTRGFEAVRYARRSPTDEQERTAGRLADRLEARDDRDGNGGGNA
ncbi:DUF4129 domain-containing protein [Halosimplex carlsbadense]|uniref:DUF4129 domain-containing protein n=1 Tax=Halosimplex carlsbadense TaxID=171164 RepID=UPI000677617A|nr:DUF4129 domain-containing protein [Halosimplex carlsbadense]